MARIEGVTLPYNKRIEFGLTYVFGIGIKTSRDILEKLKIDLSTRVKDLTDEQVGAIQKEVTTQYKTEGELRKSIALDIDELVHQLYTRYKLFRTNTGYYYQIDDTYQGYSAHTSTTNVSYSIGNGPKNVEVKLYQINAS